MSDIPFRLRPIALEDESFIYSSWLKSYRNSDFGSLMNNDVYFKYTQLIIARILSRATITIACDEKDSQTILGYIVSEPSGANQVVQYVYVKEIYRNLGLAKHLLDHVTEGKSYTYTHHTRAVSTLLSKKKLPNATFNPYLL